jgi:hypothetical protein
MSLLMIAPLHAAQPKGSAILKSCESSAPNSREREVCDAYVNGIITGVLVTQMPKERGGTPICLPDNVLTDRVRQKIIEFIHANPLTLTVDANVASGLAIRSAFACGRSN